MRLKRSTHRQGQGAKVWSKPRTAALALSLAAVLIVTSPAIAQTHGQAHPQSHGSTPATPATSGAAAISVQDAWVRATVPQQKGTGAFMNLTANRDVRLVAAASPVSPIVEVHEMAIVNDVMRMRQVDGIALPAGRTVELKPGGYHIMIMELQRPLQAGDTVPLTLTFEGPDRERQTLEIKATVRALTSATSAGGHGKH